MRDKQLTTALRERVFELWLKGLTYADIARNVGVTRQRVQQIVRPPKAVYDFVVKAAEGKCQDCHTETTSGHIHHAGRGPEDFNDISNLVYLCPSCHRLRHGGDRPAKPKPVKPPPPPTCCPYCSIEFASSDLLAHKTHCPNRLRVSPDKTLVKEA